MRHDSTNLILTRGEIETIALSLFISGFDQDLMVRMNREHGAMSGWALLSLKDSGIGVWGCLDGCGALKTGSTIETPHAEDCRWRS